MAYTGRNDAGKDCMKSKVERSELGRNLGLWMDEDGIKQIDIAAAAGMAQSTIHRTIVSERRPDVTTLKAIVHYPWPTAGRGLALMVCHLNDELKRANVAAGKIIISQANGAPPIASQLAEISTLDRSVYVHLCRVIESIYTSLKPSNVLLAAEDRAEYTPAKTIKKKAKGMPK